MTKQTTTLKQLWGIKDKQHGYYKVYREITKLKWKTGLVMPADLTEYFRCVNGTNGEYNDRWFDFYPLSNFKSIDYGLKNWRGIPDYGNVVNTLESYENCYVFADYRCHLFAYAIRLLPYKTDTNEVYVICGDEYKVIAGSFTDFLDMYLEDSPDLDF